MSPLFSLTEYETMVRSNQGGGLQFITQSHLLQRTIFLTTFNHLLLCQMNTNVQKIPDVITWAQCIKLYEYSENVRAHHNLVAMSCCLHL